MQGSAVRERGFGLDSPRIQPPGDLRRLAPARRSWQAIVLGVLAAVVAGAILGLAAGAGLSAIVLALGLLAPFALMLVLARPHWASILYLVLVYTDLLSILVRFHDFPALARYAGLALVSAVLGYRLFVQRERPASDRLTGWLLAYGAMVALGVLYARSPDLVSNNVVEFVRSFFTYLIVINTLTTMRRLHLALYAVMGAGVLLASLTVFQAVTGQYDQDFGGLAQYRVSDLAGTTEGARPGGTIGDANYYGQLLLIVIPVALYLLFDGQSKLARFVGLASAGMLTIAVVFTYSRGDALALAAMAVAVIIFKRPHPLVLVGGVVALLVALPLLPSNYLARLTTVVDLAQGNRLTIYGEDSIRGRAGATQAAIEMFADHPLLGVGRENYPSYQLEYISGTGFARTAKGIPPHNLYLEVAAEHGVLGILVFGGLLLAAWAALMDARRRFRLVKAKREHDLATWLAIMFIGYLVTAVSLHGAFLYILWMIISLIAAIRLIARSYTPNLASLTAPIERQGQAAVSLDSPDAELSLSPGRATSNEASQRPAPAPQPTEVANMHEPHTITAPSPTEGSDNLHAQPESVRGAQPTHTDVADLETWLAAGEAALRRGDLQVARAMVELALESDPYSAMAWDIDLRIRMYDYVSSNLEGYVSWNTQERPAYTINDRVYDFWHGNGGVPVFGYPISPRFYEVTTSGEMVEVQYFERARLEYHPTLVGTPNEVQTGSLGREAQAHIGGLPTSNLPPGLDGEQVIINTGGRGIPVPRRFFDFWEANGGPGILGTPFTHVLEAANEEGRLVWVQYFEKARLEYDPVLAATVYGVQVSRLGTLVFASKYGPKAGR
jgi:putative inorganic carbon (HCO3(-)) transporter